MSLSWQDLDEFAGGPQKTEPWSIFMDLSTSLSLATSQHVYSLILPGDEYQGKGQATDQGPLLSKNRFSTKFTCRRTVQNRSMK